MRLHDGARRAPIGIRLEVEDFRLQQDGVEQLVDVRALLRGDLGRQRLTAEFLEHDTVRQQLLLDLRGIRLREIHLVDCNDERNAGVARVRDRLDGLRHDGIVGGHDEHDDVRDLRAARAHCRKRFVAGRVQERDLAVAIHGHVVRADVLRDSPRFTRDDIRLADVVEQRRLAVVDVTHDGHDRRSRYHLFGRVHRRRQGFLGDVLVLAHRLESELAGDQLDLIEIEPLVDGDHQSHVLERESDDFGGGQLENLRQLRHRDELVDANDFLLALRGLGEPGFAALAHFATHIARRSALRATAHSGQRLGHIRIDRFLIDRAALALATTSAIRSRGAGTGPPGAWLPFVTTRGRAGPCATATGRGRRDGARRSEPAAARHGTRTRCAGRDGARTRATRR